MFVDVIYRWVSPDTPGRETQRVRDNKELAFSLASLKYLKPYLGKIYIIAKNCPTWKPPNDTDDIIWLDEEKYTYPDELPDESERPKYILHKLSRLSECFIIMDDDQYFCKPVPFDYWFTEALKPIWPQKVFKSHCPLPMTLSLYKECIFQIKIDMEGCHLNEFSSKDVLQKGVNTKALKDRVKYDPFLVMLPYLEKNGSIITQKRDHVLIWKTNFHNREKLFKGILDRNKGPFTCCVNDNWSEETESYQAQMNEYDAFRRELCQLQHSQC